jgi:hypothetical protein
MSSTADALFWIAGLTVASVATLVAGVVVGRMLRRRLQAPPRRPTFTLEDLRQLRATGQISEQEFETMRAIVLERTQAELTRDQPGAGDASADRPPASDD